MLILDSGTADRVRTLCDAIVPGSARVGPEVYIDALLARMPDADRAFALAAFEALEVSRLADQQFTAEFAMVRALACEAFYSDFVAPGAEGPGAWSEIGFAPPLAARLDKDWSYLGIGS